MFCEITRTEATEVLAELYLGDVPTVANPSQGPTKRQIKSVNKIPNDGRAGIYSGSRAGNGCGGSGSVAPRGGGCGGGFSSGGGCG